MAYMFHGILQARILEWVTFPFSRGSSQPRDRTQVSSISGRFFTSSATREAQEYWSGQPIPSLVGLPNPGIKPGSPVLQMDSLPTGLSGKPLKKKRAWTQSPTTRSYAVKFPAFGEITEVNTCTVQCLSLSLGEPPSWSWYLLCQVSIYWKTW